MQALTPILANILPYIQLILSAILIAVILLQQSDASLGGAFGGGDNGSIGHTRRGAEKVLFNTTIIVGILFTASAFLALLIHV